MKNNLVIEFNQVSKKYKIGHKLLLKQALLDIFKLQKQDDFWSVKNLNFQIHKGEAVGIIGANGSGKSTILKLIAGVLTPTNGQIKVLGRISPLIELGAGFHPELTGRENIYLNGTILGLSKKEIDEKFASIVAFSEIEKFIDTPVKHYSSGMYMRLGFSIAISVDPEILLVDEILAVGDIAFQKKCLEKMKEFQKSGITIILVSHSLDLIKLFCQKFIFLKEGKIVVIGNSKNLSNNIMDK
jgi:ABC-type polysaccharide/polyol phosphate transport system ATPase subunit